MIQASDNPTDKKTVQKNSNIIASRMIYPTAMMLALEYFLM